RNDGAFEEKIAKHYGFKFILIPMSAWTYPDDAMVNQALAALRDPSNGVMFVHCLRGKDRTGLIVALHRVFAQGWAPRAAYDEWVSFGLWQGFVQFQYYFYKKTKAPQAIAHHTRILPADPVVAGN
ncbi:MAG TPA: tyrosine-protein phosphatase, partial [Bdellovibrionales bacterium]|nr:tyrosine-protein phosphatase [Bdellovibrionales bacterium]